jgi:drug/metabolite transporter (DMT)-like permease
VPSDRSPRTGFLLVAFAAVFFVMNAGVSRAIQAAGVDSVTLTTVRCTGTALVLVVVLLSTGGRLTRPAGWREALLTIGFGVTGVALVQWLYFVAIDRLPVGVALLLEFTAPVLVTLFARFVYREEVKSRMWLAIACSLGGLALVAQVWNGLALDAVGVVAGLSAAVALAAYFLLGERSVSDKPPLLVLTEAFLVAAVFWNLVRPVTSLGSIDLTASRSLGAALSGWHAPLWVLLTWMVLLGTVVPFLAELSALRHLSASEVTLLAMLEPVGAAVLGWLWFHEDLNAPQMAGIALVLFGIALAQTARVVRRDASTVMTT